MASATRLRRLGLLAAISAAIFGFGAPAVSAGLDPLDLIEGTHRWMSGTGVGISHEGLPVPHTFTLKCDQTNAGYPNALTLNWKDLLGNSYSFRLYEVTTTCFWEGTKQCDLTQFEDCFNVVVGSGTGRFVGRSPSGAVIAGNPNSTRSGFIDFRFADNGPAKTGALTQLAPFDEGQFTVTDLTTGDTVMITCGCDEADYRAHQRRCVR